MSSSVYRLIVLGCGSRFASDCAAGLEVVSMLQRIGGHTCEVAELDHIHPAWLDDLPGNVTVIFVDAVRSGQRPGTIHGRRLNPSGTLQFPPASELSIQPAIRTILEHARGLPPVYFLGIEIEKWDPGLGITTSVHSAVVQIVGELARFNGKGQPKLPFFTETSGSDYRS